MNFCKCNGVCFGFVACWGGDCYVQSCFDEEGVEVGWESIAGVVNVDVSYDRDSCCRVFVLCGV